MRKILQMMIAGVVLSAGVFSFPVFAAEPEDGIVHSITQPDAGRPEYIQVTQGYKNETGEAVNVYIENWLTFEYNTLKKIGDHIANGFTVRSESDLYVVPVFKEPGADIDDTPIGSENEYDPQLLYYNDPDNGVIQSLARFRVNKADDSTNIFEKVDEASFDMTAYIGEVKTNAENVSIDIIYPESVEELTTTGVYYVVNNEMDEEIEIKVEDWTLYGNSEFKDLGIVPANQRVTINVPASELNLTDAINGSSYSSNPAFHVFTNKTKVDNVTEIPYFVYKNAYILNKGPELELSDDRIELETNASFIASDYIVSANHHLVGDLTDQVVWDDSGLDMSTPGTYDVDYRVDGPYGLSDTKTLTVVVNESSTDNTDSNNTDANGAGEGVLPETGSNSLETIMIGASAVLAAAGVLIVRKKKA